MSSLRLLQSQELTSGLAPEDGEFLSVYDSRPHPRIVKQLAGGNQYYVNL
jgi:hypothetical protein